MVIVTWKSLLCVDIQIPRNCCSVPPSWMWCQQPQSMDSTACVGNLSTSTVGKLQVPWDNARPTGTDKAQRHIGICSSITAGVIKFPTNALLLFAPTPTPSAPPAKMQKGETGGGAWDNTKHRDAKNCGTSNVLYEKKAKEVYVTRC